MPIKDVARKNVVTVMKGCTLKEVARLMESKHVGSVVVIDLYKGKKIPSGIVTDRDLALTLNSAGNPQDLKVETIMHSQPIVVKSDEGILETMIKMREYGIKRIPIVNNDASLCGIVCADDLLANLGEEIGVLAKITETQIIHERGIRLPTEKHVVA
jgi:signal-transduction protein with cAMP-binding, CBS, and nucleotidyltransferase domain